MENKKTNSPSAFERMASSVTKASGSSIAFMLAITTILVWLISGPFFSYSDTWQLVINTGTTVITFLMVFLIQRSQNKDSKAVHLKLNELLASNARASNRLVCIEDLSEEEMKVLQKFYEHLALKTKQALPIHESHSIDEAEIQYNQKINNKKLTDKNRQQSQT
jgi:low affinity Fe/Cu permease